MAISVSVRSSLLWLFCCAHEMVTRMLQGHQGMLKSLLGRGNWINTMDWNIFVFDFPISSLTAVCFVKADNLIAKKKVYK